MPHSLSTVAGGAVTFSNLVFVQDTKTQNARETLRVCGVRSCRAIPVEVAMYVDATRVLATVAQRHAAGADISKAAAVARTVRNLTQEPALVAAALAAIDLLNCGSSKAASGMSWCRRPAVPAFGVNCGKKSSRRFASLWARLRTFFGALLRPSKPSPQR